MIKQLYLKFYNLIDRWVFWLTGIIFTIILLPITWLLSKLWKPIFEPLIIFLFVYAPIIFLILLALIILVILPPWVYVVVGVVAVCSWMNRIELFVRR